MDKADDHHEYCCGGFDPEDIVITGMSGRFPECKSVGELLEGLMTKRQLIVFSDARYEKGACQLPFSSGGTVADVHKFDADYFCLPYPVVDDMDPAARKCLEVSYEAIADAGYDPVSLRGSNIGVYNATINDDASLISKKSLKPKIGFSWIRCLQANRVSYALDFVGPSCVIDTACSSSAAATWAAIQNLQQGKTDAAVVSACQLNLSPALTQKYLKLGICSKTGVNSIPFDANTDGINRTEAMVAIFLQKAKYARRAYATICSTKFVSSGFVAEGMTVPSFSMQVKISNENLEDSGLQPEDVDFIEAHGTGTVVGDPIELNALASVYCSNKRKKPMYVGTIKSNIGHTEAAAGLSGIIKAILAFETGKIPPNYKYFTPNPQCQALVDGKLKVVTEPLLLKSPYIPVNSFGLGGTLCQIMLKQNPNTYSEISTKISKIPKMILFPATTEQAVQFIFDYIRDHPDLPEEFFALLHKLSFCPTFLKPIRGYAFYREQRDPMTEIKICSGEKRPVWFIYTGMGCQWRGMGLQLMEIDVFAESMRRCAAALKPFGFNLFDIIKPDSDILDRDRLICNAIVAIVAIQISLTNVLSSLDILPDGIVGHSTGEVLAAYADGCFSLEETILSAYARGLAVEESNLCRGAMAAIGLGWEEAVKRCPKNVFPSCHNADDSVTISGLEEDVEKFVATLKKESIFAKAVNAYGYCFHCKYVDPVAPFLRDRLLKIIPKPRSRTSRWVSSCYLESEWNNEHCKVAGAEYFVHNLTAPVRFNEAIKKIPANAVIIELGPHFLLQSIMKRAVGPDSLNLGLMKRNEPDNLKFFFQSIGKLYLAGINPKIEALYPPVKFPVPRGTPRISDLIKWNYSMNYDVPKWELETAETSRLFNLEKEDAYLLDHFIDGRSLFPATGYLFLAWEMLASKLQKNFTEMPVLIENFKIHRATVITQTSSLKFNFTIPGASGYFEILDGRSLVASGQVFEWENPVFSEPEPIYQSGDGAVSGADIYNELKMIGYEHKSAFQSLIESNMDGTKGLVMWQDRWIPFLDALLLFFGLIANNNTFQLPTGVLSLKIDPSILLKRIEKQDKNNQGLPVNYHEATKTCRSVGVEITKLAMDPASHRAKDNHPNLEEYKFVPYVSNFIPDSKTEIDLLRYMWACNKVLREIGQKLGTNILPYKFCVGNDSSIDFENYKETMTENQTLLRFLLEVSEKSCDIKSKTKELYSHFRKGLGNDLLNNLMITEYPLRIMLEIIMENNFKKLTVIEVNNSGFTLVLPSIICLIEKYSYMKFKSTLLAISSHVNVDAEDLNRNNIEQKSFDSLGTLTKENQQDLVIGSFIEGTLVELKDLVQILASMVKPTGFVLFFCKEKLSPVEKFLVNLCGEDLQLQSQTAIEKVFEENNLLIVSKIFDSFSTAIYLLRPIAPIAPYKILKIEEDSIYQWIENLKQLLFENLTDTLWLVAEDTSINGIIGMVNCLKQEPGGERVKCIFISTKNGEDKPPPFSFEQPFYKLLLEKNLIMNIWRDGSWGSFKHVLLNNHKELKNVEHSYVNCRKYGDLSSFEWIESYIKYASKTSEKLIHIYYSALNFRDVMMATGKLSLGTAKSKSQLGDDSVLGLEFSGRDESGLRVAGMVPGCAMATSTLVHPSMLFVVPDSWTLEEAATVPVVYVTSYYALLERGQLKKGEKVLIHSGTGGVGIAAINVALSLQCEVFTTVGSDDKKRYLRNLFPQIKEENIGCSRNVSFESMIMRRTNGKGVDVVLNSLADDKFLASVRCVAKHGRFIEIGKYDLNLDRSLGLKVFLENISFHGVHLDQLFDRNPHNVGVFNRMFQLVRDGIQNGVVKPLDRTLFERSEVEQAFRYMAKGIHVGKVLLKIREQETDRRATPKPLILPAMPNTYFYTDKVYIIIGGLGGFGIEVTKWILSRGGKNVVLTSRYGARTAYQQMCLKRWKKLGANVQVLTLNAAKRSEAEQLLKEASKIGQVGGIFNSAVVLKDAFIESQTPKAYNEVCAPKATATKYLDELSRKLCSSLDYFICFSSISCGRGNAGQTNYGYANSVMERICEQRRNIGLHGLAIQWGIIGEVGVVHRHMGDDAMIAGVCAQSVKSCLDALDLFCQGNHPVVSSYMPAIVSKKEDQPGVISQIVKVLGMEGNFSEVAANRNLGEMGIDSLIGVEIRQLIETSLDISISMQELFKMKLSDLKGLVANSDDTAAPKAPSLICTLKKKLPSMLHKEPILKLNKVMNGIPIFIINIGDSDISNFDLFSRAVEKPVYTLQWTKSITAKNMEELAKYFLEMIRTKTRGGSFHLIGFSIGGALAFEIAGMDGRTDKCVQSITLLDGSESLFKSLSNEPERKNPEVSALLSFVEQFSSDCTPQLESELLKAKTLDQRTKIIVNFLTSAFTEAINKNELSDSATEYIKVSNIVQSYTPASKLLKDIILFEDPTKVLANDITELKRAFQQVVTGKIIIHRLLSQKDLNNEDVINKLCNIINDVFVNK